MALFAEEYVRKGDRVYVEGRVEYDSYEREGVTIPTAEIAVRELVLLSPPRNGGDGVEEVGSEVGAGVG
jgi:single-strand DNA-binding protein